MENTIVTFFSNDSEEDLQSIVLFVADHCQCQLKINKIIEKR